MALLLRMGGVPARVATGFSPGGYSERKQAWIVRDTDAHSWVEVWFDDYGWVTLDPTPSATPARSQIAAISAPATPRRRRQSGGRRGRGRRRAGRPPRRRLARGALQPAARRRRDGDRGRRRRGLLRAAAVAADRSRRCCSPRSARCWSRAAAARARTTRSTARSTSSRPRCGARAARRPAGTTLRQLERRLGLSGDAAGYLRAVGAARYAPAAGAADARAAPRAAPRARGRRARRPRAHVVGAAAAPLGGRLTHWTSCSTTPHGSVIWK